MTKSAYPVIDPFPTVRRVFAEFNTRDFITIYAMGFLGVLVAKFNRISI